MSSNGISKLVTLMLIVIGIISFVGSVLSQYVSYMLLFMLISIISTAFAIRNISVIFLDKYSSEGE